ncbi:hypothetical protein BpHYR1_009833 [Brachionus plicatilis]|uniref:Uncharacterized protein n=1 Tax=Brachionus plicatilis TaxID=10195 RepID=A0A3M7Q9D1_BRAPC|nr:hypothetical protein BpHYR1_009833 [Brachionus plicatilis]
MIQTKFSLSQSKSSGFLSIKLLLNNRLNNIVKFYLKIKNFLRYLLKILERILFHAKEFPRLVAFISFEPAPN